MLYKRFLSWWIFKRRYVFVLYVSLQEISLNMKQYIQLQIKEQKSRAQSKVNAKWSGALLKKRAAKLHIFFITAKEGQGKKKTLPIGLYIYIHVGTQIIYSVYFFQVSVCVYVCGCSCVCWGGVGLRDNFVCWGRQGVWGLF